MSLRFARVSLVAAVLLLPARSIQAQDIFKLHDAGSVAAFGYYVGPYHGLDLSVAPGGPTFAMFCVDFAHEVWIGQTWSAYITPLAWDLNAHTRGGNAKLTQYREAAWLSTQFASAATSQWGNIHATIWQLMTPGLAGEPTPASSYWLTQANAHYLDAGVSFYNRFALVTPTNRSDPSSPQEFLIQTTTTPEPAETALLGTGLGGLGLLALARRRRMKA